MMEPRRSDEGVTLIELILAITLSSIILAATFTAIVAGLKNTNDTNVRLNESHDTQLVESYLPQDLQSATSAFVAKTDPTGCSNSGPASSVNLVSLRWAETIGAATTNFAVSYRVEPASGEWQLVRYSCRGSASPPGTLPGKIAVGHKLRNPSSGWPTTPVTTCGTRVEVTILEDSGYLYAITGNTRTAFTGVTTTCPAATTTTTVASTSTTLFDPRPLILEVDMRDADTDGIIDQLVATFSKPLPAACGGLGAESMWSLAGAPAGTTVASVTVAGTVATLALAGNTAVDTALTGLLVSFTGSCGADDFINEHPVDQAPPVVLSVVSQDAGGTAGKAETDDALVITLSEPPANLPSATVQVNESGDGSQPNQPVTLTIAAITNGALPIGTAYFDGSAPPPCCDAKWSNATASIAGPALTVRLPGACQPTVACDHLGAGAGTFQFVPAPTLTDPFGNPVVNPLHLPSTDTPIPFQVF